MPTIQRLISAGPGWHLLGSSLQIAENRVGGHWTWYVIRGAGFAAAGLLTLLMLSGIGQVTGLTYRFLEPIKAWAVHKALAIALCAAIVSHVGALLIDHYHPFTLPQLLVPFLSHYTNGRPLLGISLSWIAVALGVLAMYSVAIIVASSLGWIDSRKKAWRWLHYLSYFVIAAVMLHALGTGSDLKYGTFRAAWGLLIALITLMIVYRLSRNGATKTTPERQGIDK